MNNKKVRFNVVVHDSPLSRTIHVQYGQVVGLDGKPDMIVFVYMRGEAGNDFGQARSSFGTAFSAAQKTSDFGTKAPPPSFDERSSAFSREIVGLLRNLDRSTQAVNGVTHSQPAGYFLNVRTQLHGMFRPGEGGVVHDPIPIVYGTPGIPPANKQIYDRQKFINDFMLKIIAHAPLPAV